jgi:phosphatidylglycerophosphate synthase
VGDRTLHRAMTTDWFDGRVARRRGRPSPLGSLLDPFADKLTVLTVLTVLVVLVGRGIVPGWIAAAIVAREFLVSGLRLAAIERGIVMHSRDPGKLKTLSFGARLRARRAGAAARPHRRPVVAFLSGIVQVLANSRLPPGASVGGRTRVLRQEPLQGGKDRRTLLRRRLWPDPGLHRAAA